jgi:chromosome segregation ATPase
MEPSVQQRQQRLTYFLSRLDRLEKEVNAVANPYDSLRDTIAFMKAGLGEYIGDLTRELEARQRRIDELEKENEDLKKKGKNIEKELEDLRKQLPIKVAEPEPHPTEVKK